MSHVKNVKTQKSQKKEETLNHPELIAIGVCGLSLTTHSLTHSLTSGTTVRLFPLMTFSSWPCTTATNLSVVGSGPMCMFGKLCPMRFCMKVVFPVLYCPMSRTCGFDSSSLSEMAW